MDFIISYFGNEYYIELVSAVLATICIFLPIRRGHQYLRYLKIYFGAYLILLAVCCYSYYFFYYSKQFWRPVSRFKNSVDFSFTLLEFLVFYLCLKKFLNSFLSRGVSLLFFICSGIILLCSLVDSGYITPECLYSLFTLQAISILLLCINYFYIIFKFNQGVQLINEPTFWIATGLTFFCVCTLPFSVITKHLSSSDVPLLMELFPIFHVFYVLLFLMALKAFLCKEIVPSS